MDLLIIYFEILNFRFSNILPEEFPSLNTIFLGIGLPEISISKNCKIQYSVDILDFPANFYFFLSFALITSGTLSMFLLCV